MGFCIFFWFTWEFRFLPYPVLINHLGSAHYHTSRSQLYWKLVVVVAELVNFDQPVRDLELVPELQELEQEFNPQGPEPDFELWDPEPDLQDLVPHP